MMSLNYKNFAVMRHHHQVKKPGVGDDDDNPDFNINDYINEVPLLVDEMTDDDDDELESKRTARDMESKANVDVSVSGLNSGGSGAGSLNYNISTVSTTATTGGSTTDRRPDLKDNINPTEKDKTSMPLEANEIAAVTKPNKKSMFKQERNQLMMVIIKYTSIKITNLFPPSSSESKISLEKFLIIMVNRLKMSLPNFIKATIYLFRYMDVIYLLRYLNQSNNFANFTEMDFPLKKLIIGCFKLTLMREHIHKNWYKLTGGLSDNEINIVIQSILKKLNNKIIIKKSEIVKFKLEMFRYVKMVSNQV